MNSEHYKDSEIVDIPVEGSSEVIPALLRSIPSLTGDRIEVYVDSRRGDAVTREVINGRIGIMSGSALVQELCGPGARLLDLGSHIGRFSLVAAAEGFHVTAVDASPQNVALLRASAAQNGFDHVNVICSAVGDRIGTVNFPQNGPHGMVHDSSGQFPSVSVPLRTVADILQSVGWTQIDFIKMDIEGSEPVAIRGMQDLLKKECAPPIFYESNYRTLEEAGETPRTLLQALEAYDYQSHLVWVKRYMPVTADDFQPEYVTDYLALKQGHSGKLGRRFIGRHKPHETTVQRISFACTSPYQDVRLGLATMLRTIEASFLEDSRVQEAMRQLLNDSDSDVREAAAWYATRE